jgi:predicted nucleotidyltransferase
MATNLLDPEIFAVNTVKPRIGQGDILMMKVWGSWSHDTQLPESDVDFVGCYVAHNREMLGLKRAPDTLTGEKPDYQVHEVGKFCELLIKGNPGIIEMLFTDKMIWSHKKWMPLVANRKEFLCETVVKQYLGYSQAQIKRLEAGMSVHSKGGKPGEKWAYHMYRVCLDAKRIAEGGEPKVWKDGEEKATLMDIRHGKIPPNEVVRMTKDVIATIDSMAPWKLPKEADVAVLEDWLLWVRGLNVHAP